MLYRLVTIFSVGFHMISPGWGLSLSSVADSIVAGVSKEIV